MRGETCHPSGIAIHTVGVLLLRISKYFGFGLNPTCKGLGILAMRRGVLPKRPLSS